MRFKGDIIITDPCYICRERAEVEEYPKAKDYFSYDEKMIIQITEKWMNVKLKK